MTARASPFGRGTPTHHKIRRIYYRFFGEPSFRSQLVWTYLLDLVEDVSIERWLDVGCGAGMFLVELAKLFPTASFTGIDRDLKAIVRAEELSTEAGVRNLMWSCCDLDDVELDEFDVVSALGILEQAPNPQRTVEQLAEHARDGGRIVFTAPHRGRGRGVEGSARSARFESGQLRDWMRLAGVANPKIVEGAKGPSFIAYRTSQRLQRSPFAAAAFHVFTRPLVFLDPILPGFGDLLFCAGDVHRSA